MNTKSTRQEILVMTGTHFTSRQLLRKDENPKRSPLSEKEELAEACSNGMLFEMLPEIFDDTIEGKKLFLWDITENDSFIELDMGEYPEARDLNYSINPHLFLAVQELS